MPLRDGTATIAPDPHVIQRTRTHFSRDSSKAAEDRHIGFRWLAREARLPGERDAEEVFRAVAAELGESWARIVVQAVRAAGATQPVSLGDGAWGVEGSGEDNVYSLLPALPPTTTAELTQRIL